jgi:hypothetical protein
MQYGRMKNRRKIIRKKNYKHHVVELFQVSQNYYEFTFSLPNTSHLNFFNKSYCISCDNVMIFLSFANK